MIRFRRRNLRETCLRLLSPKYRARQDEALRRSITYLVTHPNEPVAICGLIFWPSSAPTPEACKK